MITIPVSIGELIDKLSILHVKQLKISNEEKLEYINKEFELLYNVSSYYLNNQEIENLYHELVEINKTLWDIEDKLRIIESENNFDLEFIDLARKVYFTNDERFRLKNQINLITLSEIREIKDYKKY
jgi:nitrogen-specific signal transduction histidine kinase